MTRAHKALLVLAPVALRAVLVFLVDDFDADGYARVQIAEDLAAAVRAGTATWASLYVAVWPPAWHVACAAANLLGVDAYYGAKLLSALFGGLTAVVAWALARRLGARPRTAWLAWGLVAVSPLHVLYSASAMTEAFYGFWFLLAAYCFVRADRGNGWLVACAAALLPAALTRFDVWILLPALPLLALVQRRTSVAGAVAVAPLFALGPILWFALNVAARGEPFAFAGVHAEYVRHFFQFHRVYADRGLVGTGVHLAFIAGAAGAATVALGAWALFRRRGRDARALAAIVGLAFGWLLVLWIVRKQIGWRRHYLAIGLALVAMAPFALEEVRRRRLALALVVLDLVALTAVDVWMARAPRRLRAAADFVAAKGGVVYCDEPGVRVLSRLPRARFVDGWAMPRTQDGFFAHLAAHDVRWVVFADVDYSALPDLFPALRGGAPELGPLRLAYTPPAMPPLPKLYVYAVVND